MSRLARRRLAALLAYIGEGGEAEPMLSAPRLDAYARDLDEACERDEVPEWARGWANGRFRRDAHDLEATLSVPATPAAVLRRLIASYQ